MKIECPRCETTVEFERNIIDRTSLQGMFEILRVLRDTSPTFKLMIDELAEEIWPEISKK